MAIIIDAKNLIVGRMATYAAKKAMQGETVNIVNSELAVMTGKPQDILKRVKERKDRGTHSTGPFFPRHSDRFLRRMIRGMVPYKIPKGAAAYKRIMCYKGIPAIFEKEKLQTVESAHVSKVTKVNHVTVGEISKFLGK